MKVAAVQMDVRILAREQNLNQVLSRLEQAAGAGAKLTIFPECALSGYCFVSREEATPMAEEVPALPQKRFWPQRAGWIARWSWECWNVPASRFSIPPR